MSEILWAMIALMVGIWLGRRVERVMFMWAMIELLKDLKISEDQLLAVQARIKAKIEGEEESTPENSSDDLPVVEIKLEQHGEMIYAFRKDNDQFLGQGDTRENLIHRLGERMRNVRLSIAAEDGGEILGGRSWSYDTKERTIK